MGLTDWFHTDPPDDAVTTRWRAAHAELDDVFDKALALKWYDFLFVFGALDVASRQAALRPFYNRGSELEDRWIAANDAENFSARYDCAEEMQALAAEARHALLTADGTPRESLGQKVEDGAKDAAKSLAFGLGVGTVLVIAGLVALVIVSRKVGL